jgi:putative NIF3 family GTP cyclohydrolase 1 type 2
MTAISIASAIERIRAHMPEPVAAGVDTVKCGDPQAPCTGVAVTFMATGPVLARCVELGVNLVVTHEPTFYNHHDETAWLAGDPVYDAKLALISRHGLVLWRLHDHVHRGWPDLIAAGMLDRLGWLGRIDPARYGMVTVETQPLAALVAHCKARLGIASVKVVGDLATPCSRVALLPGACGGRRQIELLSQPGVDVVICGESPEWETCEYVRDARAAGMAKALVVLGHANSEEAGMASLATLAAGWLPELAVTHLPAGDPFQMV